MAGPGSHLPRTGRRWKAGLSAALPGDTSPPPQQRSTRCRWLGHRPRLSTGLLSLHVQAPAGLPPLAEHSAGATALSRRQVHLGMGSASLRQAICTPGAWRKHGLSQPRVTTCAQAHRPERRGRYWALAGVAEGGLGSWEEGLLPRAVLCLSGQRPGAEGQTVPLLPYGSHDPTGSQSIVPAAQGPRWGVGWEPVPGQSG